ncbi:MAG TPA: CAP domain-containing protein [Candidatus Limnocylindrales bacterium]|nr:CAP domain-containing protein [Candidatus Limnocylindrales bacterium]
MIGFSQVPRGLRFAGQPVRLAADAQVLFSGVTDTSGIFRVTLPVPAGIPEDVFYFQAASAANAALTVGLTFSNLTSVRLVLTSDQSALAQLNVHRTRAGLRPAVLDAGLTAAAQLHAQYLVINRDRPEMQGLGAHEESPALPGFTPEGAASAAAAG